MDQGRDRGRAFHRVRQPDIERNLRRLTGRADEQQQRNQRDGAEGHFDRHLLRRQRDGGEVERVEGHDQQQRTQEEREVADAVDDKRLLGRVRGRLLLVVEANQQVRTQANAFPADEHHQDVRAEHQHQHEEAEQVQVREEPSERFVRLLVHVRGRVDVNQRADAGDDQDHHGRQRVEAQGQVQREVAGGDPGKQRLVNLPRFGRHGRERPHLHHGKQERQHHDGRGEAAGHRLGQPTPHRRVDEEAGERKQGNKG